MISLLNNAESFIRNNSKNPGAIRGMRREEKSDYPFRAVREVLVNAMIHRDYQIVGTEVHVDMFDDRMEIVSPGGMLNGSRIQDLDLRHVPSMRRNEIISDIFGRLHCMDRRGSGIGRILSSYLEFSEQPKLFSNEFFFSVVLPNRSIAKPAQISIDFSKNQNMDEKRQLSETISQLGYAKGQLPSPKLNSYGETEDWELRYFGEMILQKAGKGFRKRTVSNLMHLFDRYRYAYTFNHRNIADLFCISENAASGVIKKCLRQDIFQKVKIDEYRFIDDKH